MKRIISFVFVLVFSLFMSISNCSADEIGNELSNDFSKKSKPYTIKNKDKDKTDIPNDYNKDIFGDEQAFPFVAGLGKNAAH